MAEIVCCIGCSHGPLLSLEAEQWDLRTLADKANRQHAYRDGTYTYDQLEKLRRWDYLIEQNKIEIRKKHQERCQTALNTLSDVLHFISPDVVVIIGDDQHEWFGDEIQPPITVFHGKEILNSGFDEEEFATKLETIKESYIGSTVKSADSSALDDEVQIVEEKKVGSGDPEMAIYSKAISQSVIK